MIVLNKLLTLSELVELAEDTNFPSVSIFMPTHRAGEDTKKDPLVFKNLWKRVEKELDGKIRQSEVKNLYSVLQHHVEDSMFWSYQSDGLAVFVKPDLVRMYSLPLTFPEVAVAADRFYIKPALPLLMTNQHYFVLGLGLKGPRIFEGSRFGIDELSNKEFSSTLHDVLELLEVHDSIQARTAGASGAAVIHGHDPSELDKIRVEEYLRKLDDELLKFLAGEKAPIILVGVEYIDSMYRKLSNYPNLVPTGVTCSPDNLGTDEVERRVKPIIEEYWHKDLDRLDHQYVNAVKNNLVLNKTDEIIKAAYHGQIDTCLVAQDRQVWGDYEPDTDAVELAKDNLPLSGNYDLLDLICIETLKNGGSAYVLPESRMPDKSPATAVLRYVPS